MNEDLQRWREAGSPSHLVVALLAVCAVLQACDGQESGGESRPAAFQARQPLATARATKQLGEDCKTFDGSECLSGVCFHYKPGPRDGYVCSQRCMSERECPEGWRCASILPAPGNEYCVPPAQWTPGLATAQAPGSSALGRAITAPPVADLQPQLDGGAFP